MGSAEGAVAFSPAWGFVEALTLWRVGGGDTPFVRVAGFLSVCFSLSSSAVMNEAELDDVDKFLFMKMAVPSGLGKHVDEGRQEAVSPVRCSSRGSS